MTRLSEVRGRIANMGELLNIVGAMRSLAGMRVQELQKALEGARAYAASMAGAIGGALLLMPRPEAPRDGHGKRALVLCMAEHGFVGGFNERMLEAAERVLAKGGALFVLGTRGAALAAEHGHAIAWSWPMATRPAAAPATASRLANELYARIAGGEVARAEVMFARTRQGHAVAIAQRQLLPLDVTTLVGAPSQPRQVPLHNLPPSPLLEKLVAEYVFALLTEAAINSIASENAARFAAMAAAHENVTRKLSGLEAEERDARQAEITSELLDLLTGAEAMAERPAISAPGSAR